MGIFEQFPYTNFHDLNLDWILHAIQSMDKKLNEFVASNVLSYADPIQWDIETQYAKNTVVIDPKTGTAYMSINPVPVGQLLTNKYYWQPIFNYDEIVNTLKKQIAAVQADQHDTIPVAVGHGGLVWVVNKLYRLTKSLAAGSKIIENGNAVPVTVEDAIINIDTTKNITRNTDGTITDTAGTITRKSDSIIDTAKDSISASGKTITNTATGDVSVSGKNITDTASAGIARNAATITDTAKGAVSVSGKNITNTASAGIARNAVTITDTATGDVSVSGKNITNTASAGIARNAVTITDTATGDVSVSGKNISISATENLTEKASNRTATFTNDTEKITGNKKLNVDGELYFNTKKPIKYSQPVSKLNDFFNIVPYTDNNGNRYNVLCDNGNTVNLYSNNNFKNYILVGDSYAVGYTPDGNVTGWTTLLNSLLDGHLYAKIEQSGAGLSNKMTGGHNLTTRISSLTASDAVDSIICCCGRNDIDGDNFEGINQGIKDFVNACHTKFKNAKVYIGFIGWDLNKTEWTVDKSLILCQAIAAYKNVNADYVYINTDFILRQRSYMASDGKHPNQDGQNALAYGIKCALYGGIPSFTKEFKMHSYPDINGGGNYQIKENFVGGITFLQFTVDTSIEYKGRNENVTFNENYELTVIKNVELDYIVPSGYNLTTMQAKILLQTTDGTYYTLDVPAYFKSNSDGTCDLVIKITTANHAGSNWAGGIINYFKICSSSCVANPLT